jgi:hypothetical protein
MCVLAVTPEGEFVVTREVRNSGSTDKNATEKPYDAPRLTVLGTFEELTRGGVSTGMPDGVKNHSR